MQQPTSSVVATSLCLYLFRSNTAKPIVVNHYTTILNYRFVFPNVTNIQCLLLHEVHGKSRDSDLSAAAVLQLLA